MTATWTMTMWLDEDLDRAEHELTGRARLIWEYRGKPRMESWLSAMLDPIESLEQVTLEVLVGRWPLTAEGVQLDTVGAIVGQERGEFLDGLYRIFIAARILVNRALGQSPEMGYILEVIGYPTIDCHEHYPAEIRFSVAGFQYGEYVGPLLRDACPGGVLLRWVWSDEDEGDVFQMADELGKDDTDADSGFGDLGEITQTTGGYWSGGMTL